MSSLIRLDDEVPSSVHYPHDHAPCCDSCDGTGSSWDPDTNGLCWDCQATGHPHAPEWGWGNPSRFAAGK